MLESPEMRYLEYLLKKMCKPLPMSPASTQCTRTRTALPRTAKSAKADKAMASKVEQTLSGSGQWDKDVISDRDEQGYS